MRGVGLAVTNMPLRVRLLLRLEGADTKVRGVDFPAFECVPEWQMIVIGAAFA